MQALIESGYIQYTEPMHRALETYNRFIKRVNSPLVSCEENDDRVSFHCIEYAAYKNLPPRYELSICFCKGGNWWNLKAYSISQSDFTQRTIQELEQKLIALFGAI